MADLDHSFLARAKRFRDALGPINGFFFRFDVDDPEASDQLLGLSERPVNPLRFPCENFTRKPFELG